MSSSLTGTPISSCSNIPQPLNNNDGYLIARPTHKESAYYVNNRIDYSILLNNMVEYVMERLRFGSMAYELSTDYSFVNHGHAYYNKVHAVEFTTVPTPKVSAGVVKIRSYSNGIYSFEEKNVYVSSPIQYRTDTPKDFEIKLIASDYKRTVDTQSDSFDGWVYADGSTYRFGSTTIYVPVLKDFFKCSTNSGMAKPTAPLNTTYVNPVLEHYHEVGGAKLEGQNLKMTIQAPQASGSTAGESMHGAKTYPRESPIYYSCNVNMTIKSIKFSGSNTQNPSETADVDGETHPIFNYVQAMIFIGKQKWVKIS